MPSRAHRDADLLVAGRTAVITDYEARDIHGFEVRQSEASQAT
jgi:hypothetical protein